MSWIAYICYFLGGVFFANAIPHIVYGITGCAFQTPFAKPPGKGLSSSVVNVLWGFFNVMVAYLLMLHVGNFDVHSGSEVLATGAGALLLAIFNAHHFGKFHGGNFPTA